MSKVSERAHLVTGIIAMVDHLKERDWSVYIISTSYQQHAYNIAAQLGIGETDVRCTKFPLDSYLAEFEEEDCKPILRAERDILSLHPPTDERTIKKRLDDFFFRELPKARIGKTLLDMKVCGGARKVSAMNELAERDGFSVSDSVAVGDSITDMKMLQFVRERGGLAVTFNGNEYALPYGSVGLATQDMRNLSLITDAWEEGGKESVLNAVRERETPDGDPYYHVLEGRKDLDNILKIHKRMRKLVRGAAGKLG